MSITSSKPAPNKIRDSSTFKCLLIAFRNDGEPVSDSKIIHLSEPQLLLLRGDGPYKFSFDASLYNSPSIPNFL